MIKSEKILLGGSVLEFTRDRIRVKDWPHPFYTPFRTQEKTDFHFTAKKNPLPPELPRNQMLFDGEDWKLFQDNGHYRLELFDTFTHKRDRSAVISKDFLNIEMSMEKAVWATQKIMRPMLELVTINHLAPRNGLLLHGAAVRDGNNGYVFIGESGAGKTTISQIWGKKEGDITILGDERIIIRKNSDGIWNVFGTPWPGMGFVVGNRPVPIQAVYFIEHGKTNEAIIESKPILFQKLFTQAFSAFWSDELLESITATCSELIETLPSFRLPFLKDASVTDFIRSHVQTLK